MATRGRPASFIGRGDEVSAGRNVPKILHLVPDHLRRRQGDKSDTIVAQTPQRGYHMDSFLSFFLCTTPPTILMLIQIFPTQSQFFGGEGGAYFSLLSLSVFSPPASSGA